MKLSTPSAVPVYTIAGSATARPLPEWLIRKRKRSLKKDPEFANRVELLQDFEFEEASSCVRVSEDGGWVMSTGTYKPQIHVHNLSQLSLAFSRHTETLNQTFILLSGDYTKSLHLQADRCLQFHTPGGCIYETRIPRYGRDLLYDRRSAEALIPSAGLGSEGTGEVFRLNLELGRFMKGYDVDVGSEDTVEPGRGGGIQGGIDAGSVNCGAVAEESHNLLAFGTSLGTVEFWDSRSRNKVGVLSLPANHSVLQDGARSETTAIKFHSSGLTLATGTSAGLVHLYDLRSPSPLLTKDQGYGYPIQTLNFLESSSRTRHQSSEPKVLSADKRIIKIWDARDGTPWTSVEPAVDLNHVEWVPDSGMLLTANEGRQQHVFFIPQLGPAPKWCAFIDNLVEEMAEDPSDPAAYAAGSATGANKPGAVYDNYKFVTVPHLRQLNIEHLIGRTSLLRPYMHGYFVNQRLYEEANLISNPEFWQEAREKTVRKRIEKERESRIRGKKKVAVKVNKKLVERMMEREERNERRKARRVLAKGGDDEDNEGVDVEMQNGEAASSDDEAAEVEAPVQEETQTERPSLLTDSRFSRLFEDEAFEIDEHSREFQMINPSTKVDAPAREKGSQKAFPKGLTAAEEEALEPRGRGAESTDEESEDDAEDAEDADEGFRSAARDRQMRWKMGEKEKRDRKMERKSGPGRKGGEPRLVVSSSGVGGNKGRANVARNQSFESRAALMHGQSRKRDEEERRRGNAAGAVGEKEVTFVPEKKSVKRHTQGEQRDPVEQGRSASRGKDRRSASGNTFRRM